MIFPELPRAIRWGGIADWLAASLPPAMAMLVIVVVVLRLLVWIGEEYLP